MYIFFEGAGHPGSIDRQCFGHSSTQVPHWTQRNLSMVHLRLGFSTTMAAQGQRRWQMPHRMQTSTSLTIWPLSPAGVSFFSTGYSTVSGFLNSEPSVIFPSLNPPMFFYLSVQLMQGSMVRMMLFTSARSQPLSAAVIPARFCEVGVRIRIRSRFFVPLPRA